jgi:hypothetical protein
MKHRRSFEDWKTLIQHPAQLERDSINKMLKDWESDRTKLINVTKSKSNTDDQFEGWKALVLAHDCSPDQDTIDKIMKAWESNRTHLKDELASLKLTIDDVLNYGWGLLYPGETDWDYPGQVINHLWAEVNTQKNKVANEITKYYPLIELLEECGFGKTAHGNTLEGMIMELLERWRLVSKGKLPEPYFTAIDLASHGDVTAMTQILKGASIITAAAFGVSEDQLSNKTEEKNNDGKEISKS